MTITAFSQAGIEGRGYRRSMSHVHRTVELRSIAFHRLVAERLDTAMVALARDRVEHWLADGGPVPALWAERWLALLDQPLPVIASALTEDSEEMRDLRQNTPFAGALTPRERWRILSDVR